MYRYMVPVILFLFLFPSAFGQGMKFGIFVDPVVSWMRSDVSEIQRDKARLGLDVGLMADYYFANNYAFASGISLFMTGGTMKYDNGIKLHVKGDSDNQVPAGKKVLYKIQYLKIPLGLKLKTHRIGRFVYFANLGLDPMIKIAARADYLSYENIGIGKEINNFNIAYHIGGGIKYPLGADAALVFGLSYMNVFADVTSPSNDRITINNLMFRIGITF